MVSWRPVSCSAGYVLAEERFIEQPDDATVTQGQLHVMKCSIDGLVGEVQWLRDGFGLGPGFEFDGFPRYRVQHNAELGILLIKP